MTDIHDDLATAKPPYKVIACLAVHGRLPLLKHTIERLYKKNGCFKVICSGDNPDDKALCQSLGALWVHARNKPLGNKWNQAFFKAKEYSPDAVVFVGSSDWLSDDWFQIMRPYVEKYGFAGVPGCSLVDIGETLRGVHWAGYKGYRKLRENESIGIGRMLSARLLDAIGWLPFDHILNNSLDWSMKNRSFDVGFTDFMVHNPKLIALSISTPKWSVIHQNKHRFDHHYPGSEIYQIPSTEMDDVNVWCENNFPEVKQLHKTLYA